MAKVVYLCARKSFPPTGFFAFKGLCLSGQCPRCLSTMHTSGVFSIFAHETNSFHMKSAFRVVYHWGHYASVLLSLIGSSRITKKFMSAPVYSVHYDSGKIVTRDLGSIIG